MHSQYAARDPEEDEAAPRVPLVALGLVVTAVLALVVLSRRGRVPTPSKSLKQPLVVKESSLEDGVVA